MNNKILAAIASAAMLVVFITLVALIPSKDICSDDVRGYVSTASSSLDAARENLSKIRTRIDIEDNLKVPSQLEGLSTTDFAALKACDTQCKLLGRCLRFVFLESPSHACPKEYSDYMARSELAIKLLEELHRIEMASKEAGEKAKVLEQTREIVKENGSRAAGNYEVQLLEHDLSQTLYRINQQIDQLLLKQPGSVLAKPTCVNGARGCDS